jgi:hypothetical protein
MSAFMHSAVSSGTPDMPPPGLRSSHRSNITAQRYRSLEGTTMPDGQTLRDDETPNGPTLEDWIKNQEGL